MISSKRVIIILSIFFSAISDSAQYFYGGIVSKDTLYAGELNELLVVTPLYEDT